MRLIKWAIAAAIFTFAFHAIEVLGFEVWRCNIVKKRAQTRTLAVFDAPFGRRVARIAYQEMRAIEQCLSSCPTDVDAYMTLALTQRLLNQNERAAETYRTALRYDRRPEIFFNLGAVLLRSGQRDAATAAFIEACRFDINLVNEIADVSYGESIAQAVRAERERARTRQR